MSHDPYACHYKYHLIIFRSLCRVCTGVLWMPDICWHLTRDKLRDFELAGCVYIYILIFLKWNFSDTYIINFALNENECMHVIKQYQILKNEACHLKHSLCVVVNIPIVKLGSRIFWVRIMCDSYTCCKHYRIIDWDGVNLCVFISPTLITTWPTFSAKQWLWWSWILQFLMSSFKIRVSWHIVLPEWWYPNEAICCRAFC